MIGNEGWELPAVLPNSRFQPTAVPLLAEPIESVTLTGNIVLPTASPVAVDKLRVVSNQQAAPVGPQGDFSIPARRGSQNTTLAIAVNDQGNAILLRSSRGDKTRAAAEMSAASTARALVLFDLAILTLPGKYADRAETLVESQSGFKALQTAVEQAVRTDPLDPLNAETHRTLYEQASRITRSILQQMDAQASHLPPGAPVAVLASLRPVFGGTPLEEPAPAPAGATCTKKRSAVHPRRRRSLTHGSSSHSAQSLVFVL